MSSSNENALVDIEHLAQVARRARDDRRMLVAVDNTFLGPLWQRPLGLGADLVFYSVTKFIGGHSDVIAGACLGPKERLAPVRTLRTFLGTMAGSSDLSPLLDLRTKRSPSSRACTTPNGRRIMNRIDSVPFANALAMVSAGAFLVCLVLAAVAPDAFLAILGSWFHGTVPAGPMASLRVTAGGLVLGLLTVALSAWAFGLALAALYNRLQSRASGPRVGG